MTNDFLTLIVVPHAKAKFRKIQVPLKLVRWVSGLGAVAAMLTLGFIGYYGRVAVQVSELEKLRTRNQVLTAKAQDYEQNAAKMQVKLLQLQGMVNKLGVMAGLDHPLPDAAVGGVGGETGMDATSPSTQLSLSEMDRSLSALNQKSAQLEQFYREQKVLLSSTPSVWPVRGYLSAYFGNRMDPFTNRRDFHPGIDISTATGSRITAPADGLVVSAEPSGGYGNALVIDHGYGVVTRYAHMSAFNVKPGQRVRRGEVIGFVGSTGRSTGPHLHYEVWVHDQAQNPIHYILDEYRTFG